LSGRENIAATLSANYCKYLKYFSLPIIPLLIKGLDLDMLLTSSEMGGDLELCR
jgi:hypothetical protein